MDRHIIINIGRQFGSGGKAIAKILSSRLGIPLYDNELITEAAKRSGFSPELFLRSDEKRNIFSMYSFFTTLNYDPGTNSIGDNELFKIQSDTIRGIAQKEEAIFVGRCSNYILRDMDCLDVFITAPLEKRIDRVSEREGISREEARSFILKKEKARQTYYNYFTFGDWGVASNYDMCMDSTLLGIEGCADVILDVVSRKWSLQQKP